MTASELKTYQSPDCTSGSAIREQRPEAESIVVYLAVPVEDVEAHARRVDEALHLLQRTFQPDLQVKPSAACHQTTRAACKQLSRRMCPGVEPRSDHGRCPHCDSPRTNHLEAQTVFGALGHPQDKLHQHKHGEGSVFRRHAIRALRRQDVGCFRRGTGLSDDIFDCQTQHIQDECPSDGPSPTDPSRPQEHSEQGKSCWYRCCSQRQQQTARPLAPYTVRSHPTIQISYARYRR
mmetsp:Transcript_126267/g.404168  ORF Transcript_126267/g.404168 Transcript_126267/m.404168 type:complete len:235 (-) Transcript_126267:22-726(-)